MKNTIFYIGIYSISLLILSILLFSIVVCDSSTVNSIGIVKVWIRSNKRLTLISSDLLFFK